jgi:hypothetical protein
VLLASLEDIGSMRCSIPAGPSLELFPSPGGEAVQYWRPVAGRLTRRARDHSLGKYQDRSRLHVCRMMARATLVQRDSQEGAVVSKISFPVVRAGPILPWAGSCSKRPGQE